MIFLATEPDRAPALCPVAGKSGAACGVAFARTAGRLRTGRSNFLQHAGVEIAGGLAEEIAGKFEISQDSRSAAGPSAVNLLWMRTEFEKLLTARPGMKRLEPVDLEVIVAFREEREIGKLLRAIGERKCAAALATLRELLASKVAETLILWCIGDLFRQAMRGVATYGNRGSWSRGANPYSTLRRSPHSHRRIIPARSCCRPCTPFAARIWELSLRGRIPEFCWNFWCGKLWWAKESTGEELPSVRFLCPRRKAR